MADIKVRVGSNEAIKVVMTANTQANPPRLKNFRAIALRSFEIT